MSDAIRPFTISVSDDEIADLRDRLARTRWADPEPVDDWSQGIPLAYTQELCAYWAESYDWRRFELSSTPTTISSPRSTASTFTPCTSARRTKTQRRWC